MFSYTRLHLLAAFSRQPWGDEDGQPISRGASQSKYAKRHRNEKLTR